MLKGVDLLTEHLVCLQAEKVLGSFYSRRARQPSYYS